MNTRETLLGIVRDQLGLDEDTLAEVDRSGRLDAFTAVDSLFTVELVMTIEERFSIRFDPEDIDAEMIGDLGRLSAFVDAARESQG